MEFVLSKPPVRHQVSIPFGLPEKIQGKNSHSAHTAAAHASIYQQWVRAVTLRRPLGTQHEEARDDEVNFASICRVPLTGFSGAFPLLEWLGRKPAVFNSATGFLPWLIKFIIRAIITLPESSISPEKRGTGKGLADELLMNLITTLTGNRCERLFWWNILGKKNARKNVSNKPLNNECMKSVKNYFFWGRKMPGKNFPNKHLNNECMKSVKNDGFFLDFKENSWCKNLEKKYFCSQF